jgi:hypothetical protein
MQFALQASENIGWLAVLAGLLLLVYRAGRLFGSILLACLAAIAIWSAWNEPIVEWLDYFLFGTVHAIPVNPGKPDVASAVAAVGNTRAIGRACESLLILWLGLSFLLAVMSARGTTVRPNRSSRQSPLRGTA